jgi:hypothetical protein
MSRSIDAVIAPGMTSTRVLITQGPARTLLTAHLAPSTRHPRALPYLLEALAFWEGTTVHAVLAVDDTGATYDTTLYRDVFAEADTPLYRLDWVPLTPPARHRTRRTDGLPLGDFRDLRHLVRQGGEG